MKIGIIGTGYVGLVTGTCLADMGNEVICVDNDENKLEKLNNNKITIYERGLEELFERNVKENRLNFTKNLSLAINNSQVIFLCLPTPQGEDGSADLKHFLSAVDDITEILKSSNEYKVIVNKSTVPVGTAKVVSDLLEEKDIKNCDVVSNPEFLREGFAVDDFMKPDRIVLGSESKQALNIMKKLYEPFVRHGNPIFEMDTASAEVTKYAANSYLAMRITYMNQIANYCEQVGADVDLVRKGIGADSRIGKKFLFPGIGYGGSCFPKDVNALIKSSLDKDVEISLLSLVDKINKNQKLLIVDRFLKYYEDDVQNKTVAIWGLSFKPNTDDVRESPSIYIVEKLLELGVKINAYDPVAIENFKTFVRDDLQFADDIYDATANADALFILTEWNEFRNPQLDKLLELMKNPVIFDGRNVLNHDTMADNKFDYYSIGRTPILNRKVNQ